MNVLKSSNSKLKERVVLGFILTQHSRDRELLIKLIEYLGCGNVSIRGEKEISDLKVTKFIDLKSKIIPFFKKYPLIGNKVLDFYDFCEAADIMMNKGHLDKDGLEQIREIQALISGRK